MPNLSAASPVEASSRMYQTTRPWLVPRWSGSVTVPSPFSCALLMNKRLPPPLAAWAPRASSAAESGEVRLVLFLEQPAAAATSTSNETSAMRDDEACRDRRDDMVDLRSGCREHRRSRLQGAEEVWRRRRKEESRAGSGAVRCHAQVT